ncbi:MAG: hypothetical protein JWQ04_845, partial [Pedosphaera sp.]|nr:hypothetical protein [Pedosphaera sp.]
TERNHIIADRKQDKKKLIYIKHS